MSQKEMLMADYDYLPPRVLIQRGEVQVTMVLKRSRGSIELGTAGIMNVALSPFYYIDIQILVHSIIVFIVIEQGS